MKHLLMLWLLGLACLSGPAGAAERFNLNALKHDIREITNAATRAKVRLRHAGAGGAEQARELENILTQLQALSRRIEEMDFPIRSAVSKTDRLRREMESKERELERIKQRNKTFSEEFTTSGENWRRKQQEILNRYPANLEFDDANQMAAFEREKADFVSRHDTFVAEGARRVAVLVKDIERGIYVWSAAQREFSGAAANRDQLLQQGNGLLRQYAATRGQVAVGIAASERVATATPVSVPLTPFAQPSGRPELAPRQRMPVQTDTNAMSQLTGAATSPQVAAGAGLGGSEPARWRFDTAEGLAGPVPAVAAPEAMGARSSEPSEALVETPSPQARPGEPATPPPPALPPRLAANPKLKALAAEQEENRRQLSEFRALQSEIAQAPDKYEASAMAAVTENLSRAANKDVTLRYMAETAQGGSEVMDLEVKVERPRRPRPTVEPPPPPK